MQLHRLPVFAFLLLITSAGIGFAAEGKNLVEDPSFEIPKQRDQFGLVFAKWGGWKYEGECDFRVGSVARSGKHSCLLFGGSAPKIRVRQTQTLEPGRYRTTAYIRGLDIGSGIWNATTEFCFDEKYMQLKKNGTFGWTKLTYVGQLAQKKDTGFSFGLMAPGYFWIDDVTMERVGNEVPLTESPVLSEEESAISPPGPLTADVVRCSECGYKNMPAWKACYACGTPLETKRTIAQVPPVKVVASFDGRSPFDGGSVVASPAAGGKKVLKIEKDYASMMGPRDWTGYDYLKADVYTDSKEPIPFYLEIRDKGTRDYWTRVNYSTVVPPGKSTLIIPVKQLYVGEKSRPGRMLDLAGIVQVTFSIGDKPPGPLLVERVWLERDDSVAKAQFAGLSAFDFGTGTSPVMEGFTPITPSTLYSKGRGYGLLKAQVWRAMDVLQPDPLYQDFVCIESGGLAVDVPNGKYHVWVNVDNPSGFWGEYQVYRQRAVLAEGRAVVTDTMNFESVKRKYFSFADQDDLPTDDTFDKYQKSYYHEKQFDVEVKDGQLNLDFKGENFGCSVAAVVIFPVEKKAEGERFLKFVEDRRRFHFDNYFKRILHRENGDTIRPSEDETRRGFVVFHRDFMEEVYYNDTPRKGETIAVASQASGSPAIATALQGAAFAGEYEPLTLAIVPLRDLGKVKVATSAVEGPGGVIPSTAIDTNYVSYRLSRVTMEGTVYTISPRLLLPLNNESASAANGDAGGVAMPKDITRRVWLTVRVPADAKPGIYRGTVAIKPEKGAVAYVPVQITVRQGSLDAADIPVGPWGHGIGVPWVDGDPAAAAFNQSLTLASLKKIREYGFTTFSGVPTIRYQGFKDGKPVLDFEAADAQMAQAKKLGFHAVVSYGAGVQGIDGYYLDTGAMQAAGMKDYAEFIRRIYTEVQKHADAAGWLPVYYNLSDEPLGDDLVRAAENAEAYRRAFPKGPPLFTGASSFTGNDAKNPHFRLGKALHVVNWNDHDEAGVAMLQGVGGQWAFYNGGNRWTLGEYMYKTAKQFDMKFRISWHWNATAGNPYYALDCREDDYAWCNASPDGRLVPSLEFERLREGLGDYRRLVTLARLARQHAETPAAKAANEFLAARMAAFHLGQRDPDTLFKPDGWRNFRDKADAAIGAFSAGK